MSRSGARAQAIRTLHPSSHASVSLTPRTSSPPPPPPHPPPSKYPSIEAVKPSVPTLRPPVSLPGCPCACVCVRFKRDSESFEGACVWRSLIGHYSSRGCSINEHCLSQSRSFLHNSTPITPGDGSARPDLNGLLFFFCLLFPTLARHAPPTREHRDQWKHLTPPDFLCSPPKPPPPRNHNHL